MFYPLDSGSSDSKVGMVTSLSLTTLDVSTSLLPATLPESEFVASMSLLLPLSSPPSSTAENKNYLENYIDSKATQYS